MKPPIGITFSYLQLEYLGIPIDEALQRALEYNFSHIRLGTYWNRIEKKPNQFHFEELKQTLFQCQKKHQAVVLTLGVKAPRWPEFYWPHFVADKNPDSPQTQKLILNFIEHTVYELNSFSCITHWQIENEAFDPSGPQQLTIPEPFLKKEIDLVKQLDQRPVIVSVWGNDLVKRGFFVQAEILGDVVGIDLYYKHFNYQLLNHVSYTGPHQSDWSLRKQLQQSLKPIWIIELQAEPWEKDKTGYLSNNPPSMSPQQIQKNLLRASQLPVKEVFLWGFEYWLWRAKQGDHRYLNLIDSIMSQQSLN